MIHSKQRIFSRFAASALFTTFAWVAGTSLAAAQDAPGTESAVAPEAPHVRYFGFYASAMAHWNFTRDLAPFTNLTWIHVGSGDRPVDGARETVERLQEAREAGVSAVLSLEPFLFADAKGTPRSDADIEAFLVELRARIEEAELLDSVALLYPKDEPFREFRRARDPSFWSEYVTGEVYDEIFADLTRVNEHLETVFPEIPIGAILSGLELHHRFFRIPESYDWVGFSCYDNLFEACEGRSFVQHYGRLLANMTPEQRLMAVPETWARNGHLERDDWPERLGQRLAHHWEIVMAEPRFVAVVPFLWSFEAAGETPGIGMDRFGETWDERTDGAGSRFLTQLIEVGLQVKEGTARYPNLDWHETEPHPARAETPETGQILAVSADGRVTAQALDPALPHKNLRTRLSLEDGQGRLLYRSPVRRTDLALALPVRDTPENGVLPGTHGIEWTLPPALVAGYAGEDLTLVLTVFADGPGVRPVFDDRRAFRPVAPEGEWFRFLGPLFHPDFWNEPLDARPLLGPLPPG
ncbi:MAG: hypothetical protein V2I57_11760 [Xanthomonadales bacterium]|nr:hypothetical protein [Xanthomonadales bacterium]